MNADTSSCKPPYASGSLPCDSDDGICTGNVSVSVKISTIRPSFITTSLTAAINDSGIVFGDDFFPVKGPSNYRPGNAYTTENVNLGSFPCSSEGLCWEIGYTYKTREGEILTTLPSSYKIRVCAENSSCGQVKISASMVFINGLAESGDKKLTPLTGLDDPSRPQNKK